MESDPVIKPNVGGTIFETRKSNLIINLYNDKMHLIIIKVDGQIAFSSFTTGKYYPVETCTDFKFIGPDGIVFIDRDPATFKYVLNYLRECNYFRECNMKSYPRSSENASNDVNRFLGESLNTGYYPNENQRALRGEFVYFNLRADDDNFYRNLYNY